MTPSILVPWGPAWHVPAVDQNKRLIALETSSLRGSVALVAETPRGAEVVAYRSHEVLNEHAERMLGLVEECLGEAGWDKKSLTHLAVGVGPGSFTGVRVALSMAQGLLVGLGIPGVGVGSLRVVALGVPASDPRPRLVVRDARRDEFFVGLYDKDGAELVPPYTIAQSDADRIVSEAYFSEAGEVRFGKCVVVGAQVGTLPFFENDETREPDARALGRFALHLDPAEHPVSPEYVRGPQLVKPVLPPSPLSQPRS